MRKSFSILVVFFVFTLTFVFLKKNVTAFDQNIQKGDSYFYRAFSKNQSAVLGTVFSPQPNAGSHVFTAKREGVLTATKTQGERTAPGLINIDKLLQLAKSSDPYIRVDAINQLRGWDQDPKIAEVLNAAVYDDIWLVRRAAVSYGTSEDAINQLVDEDPKIRLFALGRVRKLNDSRVIDLLIDRLYDPYSMVAMNTVMALGDLKDQRAIKPILEFMLSHEEWEETARALVEHIAGEPFNKVMEAYRSELKPAPKNKITFKQIDVASEIKMLEKGDRLQRVSAALRLAWAVDSEGVKALVRALKDKEPTVRSAAAEALGADPLLFRSTETVLSSLEERITDPDPLVRRMSMKGAGRFVFSKYRTKAVDILAKAALSEKDPSVREEAIYALSAVKTRRSSEVLVDFLSDSSPEVRVQAAEGIYLVCLPEAIGQVIKALKDPNPLVREAAALSLGQAQDRKAVLSLIEVLKDKDETVRLAAAQSLGTLKEREAIPSLKESSKNDSSERVRKMAEQSARLIQNHPFRFPSWVEKERCNDKASGDLKGMKF